MNVVLPAMLVDAVQSGIALHAFGHNHASGDG